MYRAQKQIKIADIGTSEKEIRDLLKAWVAISIAFAVILSDSVFSGDFYSKFIIASLTVGAGFLLHELGHKIVAQKYGCFAEFRSFDNMLLLAIAMSFLGFIFAAPGAVMISGKVSRKKSGLISAAGPAVNLALAALFLVMIFIPLPSLLRPVAYYGFMINSWLALFNMIPFWLFDGYKIMKWSKTAYGIIVAASLAMMLLQSQVGMPK
ncbi:metalloprotease [Candidatus Woesearchaeota archaeon]|nr:metalloprotease [Candidatus Woesearchaeota archaeon]